MKNLMFNFIFLSALMLCLSGCSKKDDKVHIEDDEEEVVDPAGTVYLDEKFDKMIWGSDYIQQQPGIRGVFIRDGDNKWIVDESQPVSAAPLNVDGSSDFFDTVSEAYRVLRGINEWNGWKVYERPGYIKLGTATSTDGLIATPVLSEINDDRVTLKVTVDLAIWIGASSNIMVNVVGGGTPSTNQLNVTTSDTWTTREFTVTNATSGTRIELRSDPTGDGRFFVDNFKIVKSE